MIERLQARRNSEDGFTLVELLVVIVILGVLASIVVFAVGGISDKGDSAASKTDTAVLQSAEEAQFAQSSTYSSEQGLLDSKFLRTLSTKSDICLIKADTNVVAKSDYKVVPAGTDCTAANPTLGITTAGKWSLTGS